MATWKAERRISCFNDCRMEGCPKHDLRVEIQTTADIMSVYKDNEYLFSLEPTEWDALKDILGNWDYSFFDLSFKKEATNT